MLDENQAAISNKRIASFAWQHRARSQLVMNSAAQHLTEDISQIREQQGVREQPEQGDEAQEPPD